MTVYSITRLRKDHFVRQSLECRMPGNLAASHILSKQLYITGRSSPDIGCLPTVVHSI